jgi:hypothetical protein
VTTRFWTVSATTVVLVVEVVVELAGGVLEGDPEPHAAKTIPDTMQPAATSPRVTRHLRLVFPHRIHLTPRAPG